MKGLWNFIQYHNAVPITLFIIFGVTGAAFAASPQVRDATAAAVLSQQQQVLAGDNTYLLGLDVPAFDFELQVTNVTEDDTTYYVDYQYNMVDPLDYVWRLYVASTSITVAKTEVQGKDLGLFISKQLGEVVAAKRAYLVAAQASERKAGESQKVVSTTYSGLIGRFLDAEQETFEGYTPVINPVLPEEPSKGQSGCTANCEGTPIEHGDNAGAQNGEQGTTTPSGEVLGASTVKNSADGNRASTALISLQVMGRNPSLVPVGAMYVDLGAVLVDEKNSGVSYETYLDGKQTYSPEIDTSKEATYTVEYRATDKNGTQISVTRTIKVLTYADYETAIQNQVDAPPPPEPTPEPPQESLDQLPTGQAEPTPVEATSTPPTSEPEPAPAEATSTPPVPEPAPVEATSTPPVATSTPPVVEPEPAPAPAPEPAPAEATSTPATPDQTASTTPDSTSSPQAAQ